LALIEQLQREDADNEAARKARQDEEVKASLLLIEAEMKAEKARDLSFAALIPDEAGAEAEEKAEEEEEDEEAVEEVEPSWPRRRYGRFGSSHGIITITPLLNG
jgi:hypothetical protein